MIIIIVIIIIMMIIFYFNHLIHKYVLVPVAEKSKV